MSERLKELRAEILNKVKEYYFEARKENIWENSKQISYGGRVFDEKELVNLVDSSLDFWLTAGRYASEFEEKLSKFLGVKYVSLTNSGSSANLLAFMALTSHKLGQRRIRKGDEIITVAAGFPTTVTPILQYGAVPVFVDVDVPTYNINTNFLEDALSDKTKAILIAHTLGNPFNLEKVKTFCEKHQLWLIEDNCDALGSKYIIGGSSKYTGTIGDIGTSSFYPAHHITMGEGGAVYTNNALLHRIVNSLRDWGRDCWCKPGSDNTCNHRFDQQYGLLPLGYDHKYVFSHFGYNLKITDMQGAIGVAQIDKLPSFIEKRKQNWTRLYQSLEKYSQYLILPQNEPNSEPCWFGFVISVRNDAPFSRNELVSFLESQKIQTRMLFAGNILYHPCFDEIRGDNTKYRVVGTLTNTDFIMNNTFWIGVYPGLTLENINYITGKFDEFFSKVYQKK